MPVLLLEQQAEEALKRLASLRRRGLAADADDQQLVAEVLEELSIALHELQVSTDEVREQNEALVSAEGTIAAERKRYQELFDFAPDGYLVTDVHGAIRDANHQAAEILGLGFLSGRPLAAFFPLDRRTAFRALLNKVGKQGSGIHTIETVIHRRDGTSIPAVLRVTAARKTHDGEAELRWTLRDVSEQKEARQALRQEVDQRQRIESSLRHSEALYRHLVEYASDLVYELDADGRFTFCNEQALQRVLGYNEYELVGRRLSEIVRPDYRKSVQAFISKLIKQGGAHTYLEFPVLAKGGREAWLGQHAAAAATAGRSGTVHAVSRDITAQVRRIGELERSGERWRDLTTHMRSELESERARIAREIHDELGAALTVMRMELSLPPDADPTVPGRHMERVVRRIDNAIESVRRICSDLRPSLLDNMGLCAAIEWLAQDVQERAGIRCEAKLEGLAAEPDPDRATALFRIVQEAVTNAIRHAKASNLSICQRTSRGEIIIEIGDDGIGIKPVDQLGRHAYGIAGMLERAKVLGGSVRMHGGPDGTRVTVRVPYGAGRGRERTQSTNRAARLIERIERARVSIKGER